MRRYVTIVSNQAVEVRYTPNLATDRPLHVIFSDATPQALCVMVASIPERDSSEFSIAFFPGPMWPDLNILKHQLHPPACSLQNQHVCLPVVKIILSPRHSRICHGTFYRLLPVEAACD